MFIPVLKIFAFHFFSWISFPQAPEYTMRAVSNFFKNSLRYSQLKAHQRCRWHQWQMEKIFNQKNFNYFVWTPFCRRVNIYIKFLFFTFTSRCLQPDMVPNHCHRRRWNQLGSKFATGVNNTSRTGGKICRQCHWNWWQICRQCHWHRWCTLTYAYLREFLKKFEMTLTLFSGAWGKRIHENFLMQKISWHCPFKFCRSSLEIISYFFFFGPVI